MKLIGGGCSCVKRYLVYIKVLNKGKFSHFEGPYRYKKIEHAIGQIRGVIVANKLSVGRRSTVAVLRRILK